MRLFPLPIVPGIRRIAVLVFEFFLISDQHFLPLLLVVSEQVNLLLLCLLIINFIESLWK
jgi:hypothetical protein